MSHPILERHLKRQSIKPLYLFYGNEEFLMLRALELLREGLRDRWGEAPVRVLREAQEVQEVELPELPESRGVFPDTPKKVGKKYGLPDFLAESREASLWGPGQLLVLRRLGLNAAALEAVNAYLDHPAPRAWVVLLAEGIKSRDWERNPVWQRLQRQEEALGFFRPKEAELYQWLTREAASLGKTLTLAAAQRLVEVVGDNLAELIQELEKLALYAGAEKSLTPNLVNQLATHSRTNNIFALMEALGEPAHKRLNALGQLLDLGEAPPKILVMLARQLRLLLSFKEGGPAAAAYQRRLNLQPRTLENLAKQAPRFSEAALRSHLSLLNQIDWQLKTSGGPPRLWLEWALLKMGPG
ncbi:MAG: DNA polymerase III subunit delta [Desulfobaccales bacterium]